MRLPLLAFAVCLGALSRSVDAAPAPLAERMLTAFELNKNAHALKLARRVLADGATTPTELTRAALIEALTQIRMGNHEGAATALSNLERAGVALSRFGVQMMVALRSAQNRCAEAQAQAQTLPEESVFAFAAWSKVAFCWLRAEAMDEAALAAKAVHPSATTHNERASSLLLEGRVLEGAGQLIEAKDTYRRILVEYPTANALKVAKKRLNALRRKGIRYKALTFAEQISIADAYRANNQLKTARDLYAAIQDRTEKNRKYRSDWQRAQLGRIELLMVDQEYTDALALLDQLKWASDLENRARARYLIGDLLARKGKIAEAIRAWDWMLQKLPDSAYTVEAALSGAQLAYGARYLNRSRVFVEWLLENPQERLDVARVGDDGVHRKPSDAGSHVHHARWLLAWIERRSGAPAEVADSHLAQIPFESVLGEAATYWRARIASDTGDHTSADVFVQMLRQRNPASYYALMGHDLLVHGQVEQREDPGIPSLVDPEGALGELDISTAPDLGGLVVLHQYGLTKEARAQLRYLPATELSAIDRIAAAYLYRAAGDQHRATIVARRAVQRPLEALDALAFQLAFPRPFGEIVEKRADEYGVPTNLLFAIMREESGFNPDAISPRKARGLMQMIRPTAKRMAADAELRRFRVRDLFAPPTSVHLGTHYVAGLMQKFNNSLVAAIASYQAGEGSVSRWLAARGSMPADEFIEDIPFSSTRRYVKKVLSSYGIYRMLYGRSAGPTIGLPFSQQIGARTAAANGKGAIRWARAD